MTHWCDSSGGHQTGEGARVHGIEQGHLGFGKEGLREAKIAVYDNVIGRHREGKAGLLEIVD